MKKLIMIGLLMALLAKVTLAQEQLSVKQRADKLFDQYEYFKSLKFYLKLVGHKPDIKLVERIATCYRYINQYQDAEDWYAKALNDPKAAKLDHYFYAEVLFRNQKFDQARQQYQLYFTDDAGALALKLADVDSAMVWMKQPSQFKVNNVGGVNTPSSDWGAAYGGQTTIIFTSDRETEDGKKDNRTGNGWFKLYTYDLNTKETKQLFLDPGTSNEFKDAYHVGPMVLNNKGDIAYITVTTEVAAKNLPIDQGSGKNNIRLYTRRLQLVTAVKKDGGWVISGSFPYNNVQQYSVGNAALSKDGRLIYFSSDMQGGQGKTDIWYCEKQSDGSWGKPVNCGKTINSKEEENFPFVDENGVLYYASKGLPGMGGYEIYVAHGQKNNWDTPKNLKYPINSTSDDFNLITRDGQSGYLSSNRDNGQGSDDIYAFTRIKDSIFVKPISGSPQTIIATGKPGSPDSSNPLSGASRPDFNIGPIYYDLDKSFIRPDAAIELDRLAGILKQYPALKIALASYCDSRASYLYNLALSQRRAKAAVTYLVKKGIVPTRMVAKGYSKSNPVNQCADKVKCSEADHQLNRRTEIKVVSGSN
jgi:outer membrane protein OmpA-like peptidoglycan-associated protein